MRKSINEKYILLLSHLTRGAWIEICLPVSGQKDVYTVRWKETKTSTSTTRDHYYSGNFSIKNKPIYDKEDLAVNPIGLFITDFSFSEEKESK